MRKAFTQVPQRGCKHEPTPIEYAGLRRPRGIAPKVNPCRPLPASVLVDSGEFVNPFEEKAMNQERMQGNWRQFKGKVKEQWGKLTDDDLEVIAGKREQLLGKIQERHGISKEEAEKQVAVWKDRNPTDFFERY